MRSLLVQLFLKSNDPCYNLFSWQGRKNRGQGQSSQKISGTTPFQFKENAHFDTKRALQKEHFILLLKRAGVQTPRTPPSCKPEHDLFLSLHKNLLQVTATK